MKDRFEPPDTPPEEMPMWCYKCGREISPGDGDFYVVRIEAIADPTPPRLDNGFEKMTQADIDDEFNRLLEQMKDMTEQELLDQIHRRLTIHLCRRCYEIWIENPTG